MGNGQWRSTENLPASTTLAEYRSQNRLVDSSLDELMAIPHAPLPELTSVVTINLVTAYAVTTVHFPSGTRLCTRNRVHLPTCGFDRTCRAG
jgi:hypothetical protein